MYPYSFRYKDDFDEQSVQPKQKTKNSLIRDFLTKPMPLPAVLWNLLVVFLYISIGLIVIQIGIVILFGLATLFFN